MKQPAIFLDRDGVINENRADYVKSWPEFSFLPGSLDALRLLALLNWPVVVVTNQSAIGRGLTSPEAVDRIHARMLATVRQAGGRIDRVFHCPHHPDEGCACRKPRPGLLVQAAQQLGLDLERSFLVGDAESDMAAAQAAGCQPVLVKTGRGLAQLGQLRPQRAQGMAVANDLADAVAWIVMTVADTQRYPIPSALQDLLVPGGPLAMAGHSITRTPWVETERL